MSQRLEPSESAGELVSPFTFRDSPARVREDIVRAHREAWEHLASPGTWWTGAQRVAMAAELRSAGQCELCRQRREALSPYAVTGPDGQQPAHDRHATHAHDLPPAAVDAVHRLVTDPSRLSRRFYQEFLAAGLTDGQYVELLGVVTTAIAIDLFHQALGVALEPLPAPLAGDPNEYRPATTDRIGAWVPTIDHKRATDVPSALAPAIAKIRKQGNLLQALSLVPGELPITLRLGYAYYLPLEEFGNLDYERGLTRLQMEFLASRVAAIQACFF